MTIEKLNLPAKQNAVQEKINEIIEDTQLEDLDNVSISNPSQGQNLSYDATNHVWKNTTVSATMPWGGLTGDMADQSDLQQALNSKADSSGLATVATSGSYDDLSNKPTIPTVNNGTLTIQVNGSSIGTFTANQSGNTTANVLVPDSATWGNISGTLSNQTDLQTALDGKQGTISDLTTIRAGATAGSTAVQPGDLATVATSGSYNDLSNKPTIPTITDTYSSTSSNGMSGKAVASAISNKADKATSLSGYGITDAYTKTEIDGMVSAAMHYKGTKASASALPSTGNVIGDLWNVTDTGANYAWNGTAWDKMSENIDLSGYVPTSRTINSKALTGNITLSASDVGALPSNTPIPSKTSDLTNDSGFITGVAWGDVTGKPSTFTPSAHNQASNTINAMTGYSKPSSTGAIGTSDTLNTAIGKLEKGLDDKQASGNYVTYANNTVEVAGTSKTLSKISPNAIYVENGLVMGGSAFAAGLVTRGICGIGTPTATGECSKENLYINYDGSNTYNSDRQVVIQAGEVGTHYGNNLYQYTAARGDAVKGYADATYALKSHTHDYVPTARTINSKALTNNITLTASDVGAAASSHAHVGTEVTLTGYSKASSASAVTTTDNVNVAIGKLEKALDGKQASGNYVTHGASAQVGSATKGVYIASDGAATAMTYEVNKSVPADAVFTDTVYTHPATSGNKHIPSGGSSGQILKYSADGTAQWANEYSYTHPTTSGNKHIPSGGSSGQILKWSADGTATWAAEYSYTHPTTSGNKHIPSGGSSGQFLKWSADGTATWAADNNNAVTNTLNTTSKAYLTGTTTATTNTGGQVFDTGVYLTTTAGKFNANSVSLGSENVTMQYNSTTKSVDFVFP